MSRVIQSIVMPGGWHKPEKDRLGQDMSEPIRANTYDELVSTVMQFRLDNNIPLGDYAEEIDSYICNNFPHMCHNISGAIVSITTNRAVVLTLTDRMLQWLTDTAQNVSLDGIELKNEAQRRAKICLACKYNTVWNSGCGSCKEAVNRLSTILRVGQDLPEGKRLVACQVLGHENRAAVWLRKERIVSNPSLPTPCWARAES